LSLAPGECLETRAAKGERVKFEKLARRRDAFLKTDELLPDGMRRLVLCRRLP